MGKAALFFLVAVASGLLCYILVAPHFVTPHNPSPAPVAPAVPGVTVTTESSNAASTNGSAPVDVSNAPSLAVPRTPDQKAHDDLEAGRRPLYDWIRRYFGGVLTNWKSADNDPATLELYIARDDPATIPTLNEQIVQTYATHYGFNHIRFFLPNRPGDIEHWRIDSEATPDTNGAWHAYRK